MQLIYDVLDVCGVCDSVMGQVISLAALGFLNPTFQPFLSDQVQPSFTPHSFVFTV